MCNVIVNVEVFTSWFPLCRLFTWTLQLSCFERVSLNKRPHSNKPPPSNKRPPSRPLYQISVPLEKAPHSPSPHFLKQQGHKENQLQFYCHFIFNFLGVDLSGISVGEYNVASLPLSHFQLFLYPCARLQSSFMCIISSFNFYAIVHALSNAVNFPGVTRPFSSSFKGKSYKCTP